MCKFYKFFGIFLTLISFQLSSQEDVYLKQILNNISFIKKFDQAYVYFQDENYSDALNLFIELNQIWPDNPHLNYRIGSCLVHMRGRRDEAIPYLEKAIKHVNLSFSDGDYTETTSPITAFYYLAQAYHIKYRFDKAIEYYNLYLNYLENQNPDKVDDVKFQISKVYNAKKMVNNPVSIKIQNLGPNINTKYPEYAPVISPNNDFIIFTSRREGSTGGRRDEKGMFFEDLYITYYKNQQWTQAIKLPGKINTNGHEATISLSHDGKTLFIYKDDKGDGNIYMSKLQSNGQWSKPEKMPDPINSPYWETHATLAPDGKTIYFVSDRPGGYGGKDIYKSVYLGGNKWSEPENLGPIINTRYNEESPFILSDAVTLYFASEGHENMGGYDIFISTVSEDGFWSTPENIGYPINTTEDDVFYMPTADEKNALFSTSRQRRGIGDLDINYLTIVYPKKRYVSVRGRTADAITFKSLQADVIFIDKESNQIIARLITDKETGQYKITLPTDKTYIVEAKAPQYAKTTRELTIDPNEQRAFINMDLFLTYILAEEVKIKAEDLTIGEVIVLNNIYYDFDKATLRPESKEELDRLIKLMKAVPSLIIEIASHTDNIGKPEYNMKLSQARAQAVVDYLVKNDIPINRMVPVGYGATKPIASNETEEGRQLNRRTEFKILSR